MGVTTMGFMGNGAGRRVRMGLALLLCLGAAPLAADQQAVGTTSANFLN